MAENRDESGQGETIVERKPRIFMTGFPKSGLHLAVLMARTIEKQPAYEPPWCGSFTHNAWSTQYRPLAQIMAGLNRITDGTFLKGHMGYLPIVEQYLYWHGTAMAFIYRDLRDVLVSQSYHVIDENDEKFYHPGKDIFRPMGHEERLLACLCGIGPYSGLFERWRLYAPWLNVPWVHKIRFEDMINDRENTARRFFEYTWDRTAHGLVEVVVDREELDQKYTDAIVHNMGLTAASPTYRKGLIGQWREEFTPTVKEEFKRRCGDWLVYLGYEESNEW